jgi:arylsulfatase A-like enzyme
MRKGFAMSPPMRPPARHLNLLLILTDQQSTWTLGCYGGRGAESPHVDRLAREGVLLSSCFVNSACCTPSRGCLFTGQYPHRHGAYFNDLPLRRDSVTIAHRLHDAGYDTAYVGKWHLDGDWKTLAAALRISGVEPARVPFPEDEKGSRDRAAWIDPSRSMGFQDCRWMFNCSHAKSVVEGADGRATLVDGRIGDERSYTTDWLTDRALGILERRSGRPFFLTLSIPDPHDPFTVRPPFDSLFRPEDMDVPSTFRPRDIPDWFAAESVTRWHRPPSVVGSEDALRRAKAAYLGEAACIDHNVGKILAFLETAGILDDTLVVFTSDHGEYMGEHGIYAKNQLYETAYRVPFVARCPCLLPAGRTIGGFVTAVDVQQTLLGLLGVSPSGAEQGRDASPLLRGGTVPWRDEAFLYGTLGDRAGIFTPRWELAYVRGARDHILFDRREDPDQINNLFTDPRHQKVVRGLTERLVEHNRGVGSPEAVWLEGL